MDFFCADMRINEIRLDKNTKCNLSIADAPLHCLQYGAGFATI